MTQFAVVPARAVEDRRLKPAALRMLCALGCYCDREGWCWPAANTIAERIGISRQAVSKQIQVLAELGYIEVHEQKRGDGGDASNRYRVLLDTGLFVVNESTEGEQQDVAGGQADVAPPATSRGCTHKNNPKEHKKDSIASADEFESFWRIYPSRRPHSNPKKTARLKFQVAVNRGVSPATIIQGAENYAAYVERERVAPQYVKQASTWLNQECWAEYQEAPPAEAGDAGRL